jgi:glycine/D-amino acid oxidase-like deaminating enzyme
MSSTPTAADRARYAEATVRPFWLDALPARDPRPPVGADLECDLCIVGGGYTGLWAAIQAKSEDPGREVVVLEAATVGFGASGRNGGFLSSSLTHGLANGLSRFPAEMRTLEDLAAKNYDGLREDLRRLGIDCRLEESGHLGVALEPFELADLEEEAELLRRFGHEVEVLDEAAVRAEVDSPTYLGGLWLRSGAAMVDPGRLAAGLGDAALALGVRIYERSPATSLEARGAGVDVLTAAGKVGARRVLLATSAFPPLLRRLRRYLAPVYDYVLVTGPLSQSQLRAIGWERRQGLDDRSNQFHYYRLTPDDRILFGGYDAVYRFRGPVGGRYDDHDPTFARLSQHFGMTFPQLDGVRFSHRWGGAIDTCSRFSVFFGTALDRRVAYAVGYTGLGVGATRFGARVALDLLDGRETEATRLEFVRRRPVPFPPEPLRSAVIQLTRNRLAAADRADGRRGVWLRTLDRLGLGFDS